MSANPLAIFNEPDLDLLLMTRPLLEYATGAKRARARTAWLNASHRIASAATGQDADVGAPPTARALTLSLLRLAVDLADVCGMAREDVVTAFNNHARSGITGSTANIDEFLTSALSSLLYLAHMRQVEIGKSKGDGDLDEASR